jgi:hypothetical protein
VVLIIFASLWSSLTGFNYNARLEQHATCSIELEELSNLTRLTLEYRYVELVFHKSSYDYIEAERE